MNIPILFSLMATTFLLTACDNRQKLTSDSVPFSVGGIQLGASRDGFVAALLHKASPLSW